MSTDEKLQTLEQAIKALEERLAKLEAENETLKERINEAQNGVYNLNRKVASIS